MRKLMIVGVLCFSMIAGCSSGGVSQEEYDRVVAERDEIQKKYDILVDQYATDMAEQTVNEIQENVNEDKTTEETLNDFQNTEPIFSYVGNGDDVVSGMTAINTSYAHIIHSGSGHFSVKGHHGSGYDLLVNTTDPYDGMTLIYPNEEYTFEVTAEGEWTIEIYQLGTSSTDVFSGSSDFVTPVFVRTSDIYEISTTGGGHFAVKGWGNYGYDLLVNTTDENYSGKVMFDNDEQYAFFEITASREWEIKPAQ